MIDLKRLFALDVRRDTFIEIVGADLAAVRAALAAA
jgi:hypothetical protein